MGPAGAGARGVGGRRPAGRRHRVLEDGARGPLSTPPLRAPAVRAARLVARDLLDEAAAARARLDAPDDAEALHDFRVALRRLRSWLRAYDAELGHAVGKKGRRRLKKLARATGDGRDLEVHVAWLAEQRPTLRRAERAGVDWLLDRLRPRRAAAEAALRQAVDGRFDRLRARLGAAFATYTAPVDDGGPAATWGAVAAHRAAAALAELRARLAAVHDVGDQTAAHEARIAGKRLRYQLEPFRDAVEGAREAVDELKALQDLLGDMHDAHVFAAEIGAAEADAPHADGGRDPRPGLRALCDRLREREARAFAELRERWLDGGGAAALELRVEQVAASLGAAATDGVEIERKYLLRRLPDAARRAPHVEVEQGYLPGERLIERVRRVRGPDGERFYRTVKLGAGVERVEVEEETTADVFRALWRLTKGRRVRKRRHLVPDGALVWEVDDFRDRRLVLAEIELPSADTPVRFPDWLLELVEREVTHDGAFTNARLAK